MVDDMGQGCIPMRDAPVPCLGERRSLCGGVGCVGLPPSPPLWSAAMAPTWTCSTEAAIRRHCAFELPKEINSGSYRRIGPMARIHSFYSHNSGNVLIFR